MAISFMNMTATGRKSGRSSVGAGAYVSRSAWVDRRTGARYDFRRKSADLAFSAVLLPEGADPSLADGEEMWNELEAASKGGSPLLYRSAVVALPGELDTGQAVECARDIARVYLDEGMCVQLAVHDPALADPSLAGDPTRNVHAHLVMPARPIDPATGRFGALSANAYVVRDAAGEEARMTAGELRDAREGGGTWEKVYRYRVPDEGGGRRVEQLTKSQAEGLGLGNGDRASRAPLQSGVPTVDWSDPAKMEGWRHATQEAINRSLEAAQKEARVDYRSYERQGAERIALAPEGLGAWHAEKSAEEKAAGDGRPYEPVTETGRENLRRRSIVAMLREAYRELLVAYRAVVARLAEERHRGKTLGVKAKQSGVRRQASEGMRRHRDSGFAR